MRESNQIQLENERFRGLSIDLPGPLCYKSSCRFNCILYIGPNPTGTDK